MKRLYTLLVVSVITALMAGCAATVRVTSEPNGAAIRVNNNFKGDTPVTVSVADELGGNSIYVFQAMMDGYETQEKVFKEGFLQDASTAIPGSVHFDLKQKKTLAGGIGIKAGRAEESAASQKAATGNAGKPGGSVSNSWAVVIGISKYLYSGQNGLTNLIFADDDARAFARSLRSIGWSESHIKLLVNEDATHRNIMIALESWLTKAGPGDQIVLFWAGHGFPDPEDPERVYFVCHDTDIAIPATGYRMDRVRAALEERKARNVILMADACHAGKLITRGEGDGSIVRGIKVMQKRQDLPKGWIFMVGADTDRQAVEHTSWNNGAFTHSLLKGLSGAADGFQSAGEKDGIVTMGELKDYMNTSMPDETQRVLGVAKRPIIATSVGDPGIWELTLNSR
jgi:hypothetical protein